MEIKDAHSDQPSHNLPPLDEQVDMYTLTKVNSVKLLFFVQEEAKCAVTSIDYRLEGNMLAVGYQNGNLIIWGGKQL